MRILLPLAGLAALTLLALAPGAAAHVTYATDDGMYQITIGNLGEPVYTYQKTGLDLIIRANNTARTEIPGVNGTLDATLIAPGGEELPCALQVQHGQTGRYTCAQGYTLTQPGLYKWRLVGNINGSAVDGTYEGAHPVLSQTDIMFPDRDLPTNKQLADRVAALESQLADLESNGGTNHNGANESPAAALLLGVALIGLVAMALRRR